MKVKNTPSEWRGSCRARAVPGTTHRSGGHAAQGAHDGGRRQGAILLQHPCPAKAPTRNISGPRDTR